MSEVDGLILKYPFLTEIVRRACYVPLFAINLGRIDNQLLSVKGSEFSYDSGYEYDWRYYGIVGDKVYGLGDSSLTIGDALGILGKEPEFMVRAYYVTKKHNGEPWRDVELTIYEPAKYYKAVYQGYREPVDEMWSSPFETIFVIVEAKTEKEARRLLSNYKPQFRQQLETYSSGADSQYPLNGLTESELLKLTKIVSFTLIDNQDRFSG